MKTLNRSKLNYKLRKLHQYPITFASAPSGFGKTTAIHSYLDKQDVTSLWFSMYAQDDEVWAWQKILTIFNQQFEDIQFPTSIPNSRSAIDTFITSLQPALKKPLFIILDDVRINDIPKIMKAISIYSYSSIPTLHFIIITKDTTNDITPYHFSNDILLLTTNDFSFTKEETLYLCHLENIELSKEKLYSLYDYTNGWVIAISLALESYKNYHNLYYQGDLDNLINRVIFNSLTPEIQVDFIKLSTLKYFTLSFAFKICKNQSTIEKLIQLEKENHFIQTIDPQTYQFIPIFKEYLTKQLLVSSINVNSLAKEIGFCYFEQDEPLEAIESFLKINDFDAIMSVLGQYPETGFADIAPDLMITVFKKLPDTYKNEFPYIYLKWVTNCITNFPQINGGDLLEDFKKRIDSGMIHDNREQLYGEYYLIHAFLHFNDVKKMMEDFKTSYGYFNGNHSQFAYPLMITSFGSCHMLFLYYNQLGSLQEIVDYIKENIHYFIEITDGIHSGSTNLTKAEYLYEIGEYEHVHAHATLAYKKAMDKNQLSGAICCLFCLGRLSLIQNNQKEYEHIKSQLLSFYKKTNIPILHNQIDCALGYLYILNDKYEDVKPWLKNGAFDDVYVLPEARMIAYIVHGLCLVKEHNSIKLEQLAKIIKAENKNMPFILGDIYANIFEIIPSYENRDLQTALTKFQQTIKLCSHDTIISPIIEVSFAFEKLFDMCTASFPFEKKLISLAKNHLQKNVNESIPTKYLTPKEIEILELYALGKKIKDIAVIKHISINTVQTHMKSIYKKLNISSKSQAAIYYNKYFK